VHTYRQNADETLWQVGYYIPPDAESSVAEWHTVMEYSEEGQAMRMVNYLNGGTGSPFKD
jgi:hypothetical protein